VDGIVSTVLGPLRLPILVTLLLSVAPLAEAVEYTLQVANLPQDAFHYFIRGAVGSGQGELALPRLEAALDAATLGFGALLYDRDLRPASADIARSFGAAPVAPVAQSAGGPGQWQSVRWDGQPGQRAVWLVQPVSTREQRVSDLALWSPPGGLRYYIPYRVSLTSGRAPAVAFPLRFLQSYENTDALWPRYLSRAVDLRPGLAVVVGVNTIAGDWVYLVVEPPAAPTQFKAVIGWRRRGANDDVISGTGGARTK
jgi:hypothetical protein